MLTSSARKFQPFYLKKMLRRIQQRHFSLGSWVFNKISDTNNVPKGANSVSELSIDFDKSRLEPVPKKTYSLSKVEEKDFEVVKSLKEGNIFYPYKDPFERCRKILLEDLKCTFRRMFYNFSGVKLGPLELVYFPRHTDILIIGGGIVGLSIAYALREKFPYGCEIIVVDKDPNFPKLSTNYSQGMVTYQLFNDEEEIPLLKYGAEFFSAFSRNTEVDGLEPFKLPYEPLGSLLLVDECNLEKTLKNMESLKKYEIHNKVLDVANLKRKFPWLNTEGVLFGSLGMCNEGVIDPWVYMHGLKGKCLSRGITFVTAEVIDFGYSGQIPFRVVCKLPDGTYNSIDYSKCVLACGMEALNLTELLNESDNLDLVVKLPLQERMKYEFCFYNPDGPELNTPILIDPNGTYFRREGLAGHYVAGVSSFPFNGGEENDPYHIFHERVKPFLMQRIPNFKRLQLVRGWADLHEYCFSNDIGIFGRHPQMDNIIFALGFSHLGLQYMPALARAAMENIFYGEYQTANFTPFHLENLWRKQHLEAERKRKELLEEKTRVALSD